MIEQGLTGKAAIVTGSSRGIGAAIARRLAAAGAAVVVNAHQRTDLARQLVDAIHTDGGQAVAVQADVTRGADRQRLFDAAEEHFGGVDVVVNNAGAWTFTAIRDVTEDEFDRLFALNTKAALFMSKLAGERLRHGGRIVNVSTGAVVLAPATQAVYTASKAAVEGLTRVAAKELADRAITVNAVSPGATDTDQLRHTTDEQARGQMTAQSVFGRLGEPQDIADVVAFLASHDARWITGAVINASGGLAPIP
jgi:3-oxoacyl-[acyl-carrier protein] reductase